MFTCADYNKAIAVLKLAKKQLKPDGKNCILCGDTDHQAFECRENPLYRIQHLTAEIERRSDRSTPVEVVMRLL
jgi:hypothetical protein